MIDFDDYAGEYTNCVDDVVSFSGQSTDFFHDIKVDALLKFVAGSRPLNSLSVLDVGCGTGSIARRVAPRVQQLTGVDISESSLAVASKCLPECSFEHYDGRKFPFDTDSFDFVFTSCVMHHVPPQQWPEFVREMHRVIRPGGIVAVIEHNPWNPLTRRAVAHCEFDADAVLLSARQTKQLLHNQSFRIVGAPFIIFFPWRASIFRRIERLISAIPFGGQYIVFGEKPA